MVTKSRASAKATSMALGLMYGAITEIVLTLVMSGLIALAVDRGLLTRERMGFAIMFLLASTSLVGGIITYKQVKRQRLVVCLLSGAVYFGFLLSATALFFGGMYSGMAATVAMIAIGALGAAFLSAGGEGRGRKHKRKVLIPGYR